MKKNSNLFIELINDVIYTVKLSEGGSIYGARVEYVNSRVEDITGFKPQDFIKKPTLWLRLVHPDDVRRVIEQGSELLQGKESVTRLYRVRTKQGNYIWVEDKVIPIRRGRKLIGFIGIARDVTRRKALEELSLLALEGNPQSFFKKAVDTIRELMNADLVVIYEVPHGASEGILRAGVGIDQKLINRYKLPLREGTEFFHAFKSANTVVIENVHKEERFRLNPDTYLLGLKSGICAPIRTGKETYGTICIYFKETRKFSEEDISFIEAVANIIGLVIKRHRYEQELAFSQKRAEKVSRLYRSLSVVNEIVLKARSLDDVLHGVCSTLVTFGGFKACWLGIPGEDGVRVVSSCGNVERFIKEVEEPVLKKLGPDAGPCAKAVLSGEPAVNNDTEEEISNALLREKMLKEGFLSSMAVPVKVRGEVAYLLVLYSGEKGFFDRETTKLVKEVTDQIAFSVEFLEKEHLLDQLSLAVSQSSDWILITDAEGKILFVNATVERLSGYSRTELIGAKPSIFKSGKHTKSFYRKLWDKLLRGETFRGVFINRAKDGRLFYLDQTITPFKDREGNIAGFVATGKDITHEIELEDKLNYISYFDPVTDLPNRINFLDKLSFSISRHGAFHEKLAVVVLDVDRFRYVNETYCYPAGDRILIEMASRLKESAGPGNVVARLGSDEFGVVLFDIKSSQTVLNFLNRLFANMDKPFRVGNKEVRLSVSVGIALFPEDGKKPTS